MTTAHTQVAWWHECKLAWIRAIQGGLLAMAGLLLFSPIWLVPSTCRAINTKSLVEDVAPHIWSCTIAIVTAMLCASASGRLLKRQGRCVGSLWYIVFGTVAFAVGGALVTGFAFGGAYIGLNLVLLITGLSASPIALDPFLTVALVGSAIGTVVGAVTGCPEVINDLPRAFPSSPDNGGPARAPGAAIVFPLIIGGAISALLWLFVGAVVFALVPIGFWSVAGLCAAITTTWRIKWLRRIHKQS